MLWCISRWFLSPPSAPMMRGFFSTIYCRNPVKLWEVNLPILWGSLWSFWLLDLFTRSLQQFVISSSGFHTLAPVPEAVFCLWIPALVSRDSLNSPVSPILEAEVCPVFSPFLRTQEELLIFLSVELLTCCWDRVVTSKQLICQTTKWKSAVYFWDMKN